MDARKKSDAAIPPDGHEPIPPRFWWLKRIGIGVGVLIVSLVVLRIWWGWEADRRLQAEIDRIVASGEPFYPEDYVEDVPDELNAALLYEKAAERFREDPSSDVDVIAFYNDLRKCEDHVDDIRSLVELNAPVLSLMHRARSLRGVKWTNPGMTNQMLNVADYSGNRTVAKFLAVMAVAQFYDNEHRAMVETLRDSVAYGEALVRRPSLIGGLVAIASHAIVFRVVEEYASTLMIESAATEDWVGTPATYDAVRALLGALITERQFRATLCRSLHGERTYIHSLLLDRLASPSLVPSEGQPILALPFSAPFAPLLKLETVRCWHAVDEAWLAAQEGNWPAADAHFGPPTTDRSFLHIISRPFSHPQFWGLSSSYQRWVELYYKYVLYRRAAALLLGIRLFETEHGRRPETLQQLVPVIFDSIPVDPFSPTGAPLQYVNDGQRTIIYSVGFNGADDGGKFDPGRDTWHDSQLDFVFYFDGRPVEESDAPILGQAVDDDQNAENEPGNAGNDGEGEEQPEDR